MRAAVPPTTAGTTPPDGNDGGQASGTVTVGVASAPTLVITPPTTPPSAGLPATFTFAVTAAATNGSAVRDLTVNWGDGQIQDLGAVTGTATVSHAYRSAGTYTITATVTDAQGNVVSVSSWCHRKSDGLEPHDNAAVCGAKCRPAGQLHGRYRDSAGGRRRAQRSHRLGRFELSGSRRNFRKRDRFARIQDSGLLCGQRDSDRHRRQQHGCLDIRHGHRHAGADGELKLAEMLAADPVSRFAPGGSYT